MSHVWSIFQLLDLFALYVFKQQVNGLPVIFSPSLRLSKVQYGVHIKNQTPQPPVGSQELTINFPDPCLGAISCHYHFLAGGHGPLVQDSFKLCAFIQPLLREGERLFFSHSMSAVVRVCQCLPPSFCQLRQLTGCSPSLL